jgi:hypothetical protein
VENVLAEGGSDHRIAVGANRRVAIGHGPPDVTCAKRQSKRYVVTQN